jgi:hypothetical protein
MYVVSTNVLVNPPRSSTSPTATASLKPENHETVRKLLNAWPALLKGTNGHEWLLTAVERENLATPIAI